MSFFLVQTLVSRWSWEHLLVKKKKIQEIVDKISRCFRKCLEVTSLARTSHHWSVLYLVSLNDRKVSPERLINHVYSASQLSSFFLFFSPLVDPQLSSWPFVMQRGGTWRKCPNIDKTKVLELFCVKIKRRIYTHKLVSFFFAIHAIGAYWCFRFSYFASICGFLTPTWILCLFLLSAVSRSFETTVKIFCRLLKNTIQCLPFD